MRRKIRVTVFFTMAALTWACAAFAGTNVGAAVDVAPEVEKTRLQKWPRAAWSASAKCWLVVWREGDLNEQETDIWCARFSADGTAMDPAGIRLTSAKDVQDRPVVASDGKDFLVAWQDLRGGKDWDLYAARVTADGKVLDPDGFVIDDTDHNQCMPSLVYARSTSSGQARGNYYVAWQAWVEGALTSWNGDKYGSYEILGGRISSGGKLLNVEGVTLVQPTALQPSLAVNTEGGLVMVWIGRESKGIPKTGGFANFPGFLRIDPEKGVPLGEPVYMTRKEAYTKTWDRQYVPGVALMNNGECLVSMMGWRGGMALFRFDKDGKRVGDWQRFRGASSNGCIVPLSSMAGDGERALMTYDFPTSFISIARVRGPLRMKIWGWILAQDGTVLDGGRTGPGSRRKEEFCGFSIADKKSLDCMQGTACAGPAGTFLVTYAEMRGVENTKVVAALVKPAAGTGETGKTKP